MPLQLVPNSKKSVLIFQKDPSIKRRFENSFGFTDHFSAKGFFGFIRLSNGGTSDSFANVSDFFQQRS